MPRVVTFEQYLTSFNAMSSEEEFEYTVSKKDRQQNGHTKKGPKDKQQSTKHTHKTKDRVTQTPLKTGGEVL